MKYLILILLMAPLLTSAQIINAGEYMSEMGKDQEAITQDMWGYMRAASRGRSARKLDKKRQELIKEYYQAKNRVSQLPAFKKDYSYKAAVAQYYNLCLIMLREEYGRVIDLEEVAENSYDNMEAYLTILEQVDIKMDSAYSRLRRAQQKFAQQNNINLVESSSKISEKIRRANAVTRYYNDCFLIYFKVSHQESYLFLAQGNSNIGETDQARQKLVEFAREGKDQLREAKPFGRDYSLIKQADQWMDFYLYEAALVDKIIDFFIVKEELEKSNKYLSSKKSTELTQADVDKHNQLIADFNNGVATYNQINDQLTKSRKQRYEAWESVRNDFYKRYSP